MYEGTIKQNKNLKTTKVFSVSIILFTFSLASSYALSPSLSYYAQRYYQEPSLNSTECYDLESLKISRMLVIFGPKNCFPLYYLKAFHHKNVIYAFYQRQKTHRRKMEREKCIQFPNSVTGTRKIIINIDCLFYFRLIMKYY